MASCALDKRRSIALSFMAERATYFVVPWYGSINAAPNSNQLRSLTLSFTWIYCFKQMQPSFRAFSSRHNPSRRKQTVPLNSSSADYRISLKTKIEPLASKSDNHSNLYHGVRSFRKSRLVVLPAVFSWDCRSLLSCYSRFISLAWDCSIYKMLYLACSYLSWMASSSLSASKSFPRRASACCFLNRAISWSCPLRTCYCCFVINDTLSTRNLFSTIRDSCLAEVFSFI